MNESKRWRKKQKYAAPSRYYGGTGTIHETEQLDIEVLDGRVVAVWFRCQALPFQQVDIDIARAASIRDSMQLPRLTGVELYDPIVPEHRGSPELRQDEGSPGAAS